MKPFPVRRRRRPAPGFNLIELLVTMAIAAILLMVAAPSLAQLFRSNRVQGEAASFVNDMMFARTEAIRRGEPLTLCASSDGATCSRLNDWHKGWIVFSDPTGTLAPDPDKGKPVVRAGGAFKGTDTLVPTLATVTSLRFNREGFAMNLGTALVAFQLHTAADSGESAKRVNRCVFVDIGGRISTLKVDEQDRGTTCS